MSKAKEKTVNTETTETMEPVETMEAAPASVPRDETAPSPGVPSAGFSCYIGPNLHGVIQTGTIYPAGRVEALELPEVKLALSKRPEIAGLIVDGSTLAEDRIKVKQPGTSLYEAYRALKKKTGG